ncbi:MAG: hypothetical protein IH571_05815, partial [Acholeplasmataceae bacterium]|nr:hypothetical protein [Acholeplasmataceae bacterium]
NKLKKLLSLFMFLFFMVVLIGCVPTEEDPEEVTITYAAWNLGSVEANNLERRMIEAFMVEYPHITVDIVERPKVPDPGNPENEIDMNWDEMLASMAATGTLPDVYLHGNVPTAIINGWAHDVVEVMADDEEFLNISSDIGMAAVYQGKYFGIPSAAFHFGFFINNTLFEDANIDLPTFGMTWEDLLVAAEEVATQPTDGTGIVGLEGVSSLFEWLPAQFDGDLGWYTFDGTDFNLDSQAFADAMAEQQKYYGPDKGTYAPYVLEATTNEQRDEWYTGWPMGNGKHAIKWDGTWSFGWIVPNTLNEENPMYGMEFDFIGTPVVVDGVQRVPVTMDFMLVGQGTEHEEEAYAFAKWMGFGKDGYLKRIEIATANPTSGSVNFAPLQQDDDLYEAYFNLFPAGTMTEYRKVLEHDSFIIEGIKFIPGYVEARWAGNYGTIGETSYSIGALIDAIRDGNVQLADVATQLNNRVNIIYQEAKAALDDALE